MSKELCCECQSQTGRAGRHDDSLYAGDLGPYCDDCWAELPRQFAAEIDRLQAANKELVEDFETLINSMCEDDYGPTRFCAYEDDYESARAVLAKHKEPGK